jgi:dihydrofolate reductase
MKKVIAGLFMTLDGVVSDPDQWHFPYIDESMSSDIVAEISEMDTILFGRNTYVEFSKSWPKRTRDQFGPLADFFNDTHKVVVSRTLSTLEWGPASLLGGDLVQDVTGLKKQSGKNIFVPGSAALTKSLLQAGILDQLWITLDPLVVGKGKRLYEAAEERTLLKLIESKPYSTGSMSLKYVPASA